MGQASLHSIQALRAITTVGHAPRYDRGARPNIRQRRALGPTCTPRLRQPAGPVLKAIPAGTQRRLAGPQATPAGGQITKICVVAGLAALVSQPHRLRAQPLPVRLRAPCWIR